jgi:two-component sensor histidine kinase
MAAPTSTPPEAALTLGLALVASSAAPLLLLDADLTIIAVSKSFCRAVDVDPVTTPGKSIFAIGAGEWDVPQLRSLLGATASGLAEIEAYEINLRVPGKDNRCLVLGAHRLDYAGDEHVRIVLTVADVTQARITEKLKDDLLREKAILLQEVQHRVANSLQIIASVLLQSARKVQSEETRASLRDAHGRVMSIATVQRQLAASGEGDVALQPYFAQLCQSLGASMIRDHDQLSLGVEVDASVVGADISVCLGLIVTELVINALKHAFPGERKGRIVVAYQSDGPDWSLSVGDNGVGMPPEAANAKPGLGTSIIDSLAKHMDAMVTTSDNHPGTRVLIAHTQAAAGAAQGDARAV